MISEYYTSQENELEHEADMFQKSFLPSADELDEIGGSYPIVAGIQSPKISEKDDPWLKSI